MRILIVDDDPSQRHLLRELIENENEGHTLLEAGSALHAQEVIDRALASGEEIHLALIDWELGQGLTGDYVAKHLRHGTAKFLITGHSREEIRSKWYDPLKGFLQFFQKPLQWDKLHAAIVRVDRARDSTKP